jgi:hypothetical protein
MYSRYQHRYQNQAMYTAAQCIYTHQAPSGHAHNAHTHLTPLNYPLLIFQSLLIRPPTQTPSSIPTSRHHAPLVSSSPPLSISSVSPTCRLSLTSREGSFSRMDLEASVRGDKLCDIVDVLAASVPFANKFCVNP